MRHERLALPSSRLWLTARSLKSRQNIAGAVHRPLEQSSRNPSTMPSAPPRACSDRPCPNFAEAGCHGRYREHAKAKGRARGTTTQRGYDSTYERLMRMVLAEEPLCRECLKVGLVEASAQCDHIIPIRVRPDLRLVRSNLQGLCTSHHSAKTAKENGWVRH